ncbi:MAG: hypothetical protein K0R68_3036, partial [Mycobacterium sp.]|nr:hypothetical protein [Mycobacterium sp.]
MLTANPFGSDAATPSKTHQPATRRYSPTPVAITQLEPSKVKQRALDQFSVIDQCGRRLWPQQQNRTAVMRRPGWAGALLSIVVLLPATLAGSVTAQAEPGESADAADAALTTLGFSTLGLDTGLFLSPNS